MSLKKRITLRTIADTLGVSIMTVSLAMRNSPEISQKTRDLIQTKAQELGYTPDPALSALIAYRTNTNTPSFAGTIVYINNFDYPNLTSPNCELKIHSELFTGAKRRAAELGYKLEEFWLRDPKRTIEQSLNILRAKNIRGLLIGPQKESGKNDCPIPWNEFSCVKYGYSLSHPHLNTVCSDQFLAMKLCVEELVKRKYLRIGMVYSKDQSLRNFNKQLGAYLATVQACGTEPIPPYIKDLPIDRNDFMHWYHRHKPDAIVCGNGQYLEILEDEKILAPSDVGIAIPYKHVDHPYADYAQVEEHYGISGEKMVNLLVQMLQLNECGVPQHPIDIICGVDFVDGISIRPAGGTKSAENSSAKKGRTRTTKAKNSKTPAR